MGFTGAHMLYVLDVFILALYLLSHGFALLKYMYKLPLCGVVVVWIYVVGCVVDM